MGHSHPLILSIITHHLQNPKWNPLFLFLSHKSTIYLSHKNPPFFIFLKYFTFFFHIRKNHYNSIIPTSHSDQTSPILTSWDFCTLASLSLSLKKHFCSFFVFLFISSYNSRSQSHFFASLSSFLIF